MIGASLDHHIPRCKAQVPIVQQQVDLALEHDDIVDRPGPVDHWMPRRMPAYHIGSDAEMAQTGHNAPDIPHHDYSLPVTWRKWHSMRSGSASLPVNSLKPRIAWPTFMWPPSAVAQPARRAAFTNSVASGT